MPRIKTFTNTTSIPAISLGLLIIGILWLLKETGYITIDIPWWPIILITIGAIGVINYLQRKFIFQQ